ncbi:MAG: methyltransferase type 11 [Lentisphaerae bacterium RIFOXYA12_FULL_48_11]|nr:MAG: methyltransferase type 11 [Lentisphaerae bacterium RIFOXYA12_FULL_48_11]
MRTLLRLLPEYVRKSIRSSISLIYSTNRYGKGRWCPVCGRDSRKFGKFGIVPREDAMCIHCGALERHRLVWLFFQQMTNLFDGTPKIMLHIAPEPCFEPRLREKLRQGYITADLMNSHAMVKMDITNILYPDNYFDIIYCSHVLEHVQDDKKAMREFYRVLKQNGWAILLVPITAKATFEDPSIHDPSERQKLFGQEDHVRRYGADYIERLHEAGFKVKVSQASDLSGPKNIVRMGLTPASGEIYYCYKT